MVTYWFAHTFLGRNPEPRRQALPRELAHNLLLVGALKAFEAPGPWGPGPLVGPGRRCEHACCYSDLHVTSPGNRRMIYQQPTWSERRANRRTTVGYDATEPCKHTRVGPSWPVAWFSKHKLLHRRSPSGPKGHLEAWDHMKFLLLLKSEVGDS